MRISTQQKRTRIINVATELFLDQGYKDTTLDQIVTICGGSKQTLYRYFTNKEGLFMAVLEHNTKTSLETVFQLDHNIDDPLQETLEQFAVQYLKRICGNPILGLFRIVSSDFNKHDKISHQFWETGPIRIHQYLVDFLRNSNSCQCLQIEDAELACDQLLSLIKLDYQNMALLGLDLPSEDILKNHVNKAVGGFIKLYQKN
ncbi:TetR/AcrR family transcriptional regulator [Photobacterium atrarenae]|uniref:TetR/AcrR family transcriptional regulator n=1 Tax=Photobacterium atrarenae TaxID=865757 RepID=A0ABY5GPZ9_9GAMM|nr:TetR/AcrR family transcriptional regulator [Photobacterium atrarenae]UTV30993.1 TetR/AcrR family transcriptional regulator [Photobacterium atrarenae]